MIRIVNCFCIWVLLMGLMAGPAIAQISYCKDVLEPGNPGGLGTCDILATPCSTDSQCAGGALTCLDPSLKTWDEEWDLTNGESIVMDIWQNAVPESLLTGGCFITFDPSRVEISNVIPFDTDNGGPWDAGFTGSFPPDGTTGQWFLSLGNFGCVEPDGDGDIILAQVTFTRIADGNADITISTIPAFDTVTGCVSDPVIIFDSQIADNIVALPGAVGCTPPDCDDGISCTDDVCNVDTCENTPNDVNCDDGDVCNGAETCDGVNDCQAGTPLDCDDGDLCTDDTCDPVTGCDNASVVCPPGEACDPADGVCKACTVDGDCDDGDVCNGDETCDAGTCLAGTPLDCDDGDLCTTDSCDPVTGCDNPPVVCPPGEACDPADGVCKACTVDGDCDDGDVCNGDETCDAGTCQAGTPLVCDDGDACNGVEICDPVGGCQAGTPPDCDDGDLCTDDTCDPVTGCDNVSVVCPPGEACDPADGVCKGCTVDGDCDDGDVCNGDETCDAGTCLAGTPLVCDDGDACNGVETCDPVGGCQAGTPPDCDDGNLCTTDSCDLVTGCDNAPVVCPPGEECDPADGQCKVAPSVVSYGKDFLEPGNPGGLGTCDILATPCSTDSQCAAGAFECLNPSLKTWGDEWTMEVGQTIDMDIWLSNVPEDLLTGGCFITYDPELVNITNVVPYDDANGGFWDFGFTQSFEVVPGQWFLSLGQFSCVAPDGDGDIILAKVTFECQRLGDVDINITTIPDFETITGCVGFPYDSQVNPSPGIIHQEKTCPGGDADCDDGLYCNGVETCDTLTEMCLPGTAPDCTDELVCTDDSCEEGDGTFVCVNPPNDANCDDGLYCTGAETCDLVDDCQDGTPPDCDDGIDCTDDSCDEFSKVCTNRPNAANCDDGFFCTLDGCQSEPTTCPISLRPPQPDVDLLGTVQFEVSVDGTGDCEQATEYTWEISEAGCTGDATESAIGSTVDANGLYTAGDEEGTEFVRATDVNGDTCAAAKVFVRKDRPPVGGGGSGGCTTDEECDDGVFCNGEESCVEKDCVDGTPPCGAELCDEDTDTCINCLEDADCDDDLDCTDDSCVDETCVNMPNDENCPDDGLYCNGEEFCDEAEGCSSTGNPCAAGETCDEDTDFCVTETECAIDVLRDSLPKSSLSVLPTLFRIETVGIEPLNGLTPVTIACESDETIIFPFLTFAILQTGKLVIPSFGTNTTVIFQAGVILPAWITGSQGRQSETCTVTVGSCQSTDSFELNYLPFPLSE